MSSQRPPLFVAQPVLNDYGRNKIQKVFIANRGEIACRVIATCRKLNLTSIAIYVQEDEASRHISEADEAIDLGSIDEATTNPFLDVDLLVRTAVDAGAHAIHPGYGYLSENPDFADRSRDAGLIFLGPSGVAMSTLGNKRTSKAYLSSQASDVPLIPGFSGTSQNLKELEDAATSIGFPVMLKASAGGGGKGMRIVRDPSALRSEFERAQSEAKRSFGSDDLILEKYIEAGKHVEVQVVGDQHGRVVSLWDRDCSVQRRHQKVIEEAPCPWLSDDLRTRMSATAVRIAELIAYEGAGTVEFVVDVATEKYYFLEVNARLQVEHPITEEITGVDLVALQLYVATGGKLDDLPQLMPVPRIGHAIECRLCAEDASRDFFPENGPIKLWQPAPGILGPGRDIRYETAVQSGSHVSIHFDSMIAKVIVWAPSRSQAIEKMLRVLRNMACVGVRTNQGFLQSCLKSPDFRNPAYTTSFIPKNLTTLLQNPYTSDVAALYRSYSALAWMYHRSIQETSRSSFSNVRIGYRNQPFDPINRLTGVVISNPEGINKDEVIQHSSLIIAEPIANDRRRLNLYLNGVPQPQKSTNKKQSPANVVTASYNAISFAIRNGAWRSQIAQPCCLESVTSLPSSATDPSELVTATVQGKRFTAIFTTSQSSDPSLGVSVYAHILALGTWVQYRIFSTLAYAESLRETVAAAVDGAGGIVKAPLPCKVLKVVKRSGEEVKKGEALLVIESMKMEVTILAPNQGIFETSRGSGEAVEEGGVLCEVRGDERGD
ncbi:carbamoyl-phosphate synthase subunit L [Stagonosporopsis vannaccii]|nr:carbamoyl-phosphate synthase subunit L [Stagonosporopsis vannaccii]